jgi:hypothetical protein
MEILNPKQVEWCYNNKPNTKHIMEHKKFAKFCKSDIDFANAKICYYLETETYNSLPTEFKQLAE